MAPRTTRGFNQAQCIIFTQTTAQLTWYAEKLNTMLPTGSVSHQTHTGLNSLEEKNTFLFKFLIFTTPCCNNYNLSLCPSTSFRTVTDTKSQGLPLNTWTTESWQKPNKITLENCFQQKLQEQIIFFGLSLLGRFIDQTFFSKSRFNKSELETCYCSFDCRKEGMMRM